VACGSGADDIRSSGVERPLGLPTNRDRVIQTNAKIVIETIFEADFEDNAYGYRPARGAVAAIKEVHRVYAGAMQTSLILICPSTLIRSRIPS
jgi:retron-type reverse transcriptase